jgi:lipoyl(octanoyl) transferase
VYTIGKRPNEHNILATEHELRTCGAEVHKTRRGGDVTYHGPGQFVLYPVINLRDARVGARAYVEGLEDLMIDCAKGLGFRPGAGCPG